MNIQLPNAASLERTEQVVAKLQKIARNSRASNMSPRVSGFSLLSLRAQQLQRFRLHHHEGLGRPENPRRAVSVNQGAAERGIEQASGRRRLRIFAAGYSRRRHFGRIHLHARRPCRRGLQFLADNLNKFMAAARKRPEIGSLTTTFLPSVPQRFVTVDRDKVIKQGVAINDVYRTIQTFMGGSLRQLLQPFRPAMAGVR